MAIQDLPKYKPMPGIAIIAFTIEQVATYNVRLVAGKEFELTDKFHPDEHSIEEAVIYSVSDSQKELKPGDNVLVDYGIFSTGKHETEFMRSESTRLIFRNDEYYLYWCYDDTHPFNSSEVLGYIDEYGKTKAFGDAVLVHTQADTEVMIAVIQSVTDMAMFLPGTQWAMVQSSPVPEMEEGDIILGEKGLFIRIKFRGIELQYINLPYILGKQAPDMPYGIKLF